MKTEDEDCYGDYLVISSSDDISDNCIVTGIFVYSNHCQYSGVDWTRFIHGHTVLL